jgi:hypothetical protein
MEAVMNPQEMQSLTPPATLSMNFVSAPPPVPTMETLARFMILLNQRYPIDRTIGNFQGNHSVVFDTTGLSRALPGLTVSVWVWKQLEWRCYPVGLTEDDLRLTPEALVDEIARCLEPELSKLIVPTQKLPSRA